MQTVLKESKSAKISVAVLTDNEDFFIALRRALKAVYGIEAIKIKGSIRNAETTFIYDNLAVEDGAFQKWFCGSFRRRLRNPLVVVGAAEEESFVRAHPVFNVYCYNHAYIPVPFELGQLYDALTKLKPVDDEDTRRFIINDYCMDYEHSLVTHDLKIVKDDRDATILNFERVRDFYQGKRDRKTVEYLKVTLARMQKESGWISTAQEAQKEMIKKVAIRRKSNG